nr:hypothetical protein [uncultured Mucilaginibacter sp.]
MYKPILVALLIFVSGLETLAQTSAEKKAIYLSVLSKLDNEQVKLQYFTLYPTVTADLLSSFNFEHPNKYLRDTSNFHLEAGFRQFLNTIKKQDIKDATFNIDFKGKKFRKLELVPRSRTATLVLSPIVISKDAVYAVCSYIFITKPGAALTVPVVSFLKRAERNWVVVEQIKVQ